jgi:hypothetical protein
VSSFLLLEVEPGKIDAGAYGLTTADGAPVADYIVFTPKAQRDDPCIEMRRAFGRHRK